MKQLQTEITVSADVKGAETGLKKVSKSVKEMAAAAQSAGKEAADGIAKPAESAGKAASKIERETKNIVGSIERTTAVLQAGGRGTREYFETLAKQRGISVDALKPYLDQLDAVKSKQKLATDALTATLPAMNQIGVSAKQTAAALRGVPAQFTDIVTSLQGGQSPITVLLQQGGQLKDMFGGIGPAARALGGYVAGLVNPFTIAAGAVALLVGAYAKGSEEAFKFEKALVLSGNAIGLTAGQLGEMAKRIDGIVGTQGDAAEALALMAQNTTVAGSSIEKFTVLALRLERIGGGAVDETVKKFSELGKAPTQASIKFNESLNYLTASTIRQIKALEDQGRATEAATLAQNEFFKATEIRVKTLEGSLGLISKAWRGIKDGAGEAFEAMLKALNVGAEDSLTDRLNRARAQLDERMSRGPLNSTTKAAYEKGNQALREGIDLLSEQVRLQNRSADNDRVISERAKQEIEYAKIKDDLLTKEEKGLREIAKTRTLMLAVGAKQEEIDAAIARIKEKYADKGKVNEAKALDRSVLKLEVEAIRNANEQLIGSYKNAENIMDAQRSAGLLGDKEYYEAKRAFIRLEIEANEEAARKEIERLNVEKLSGKAGVDNAREIAKATADLATLRAKATSSLQVLSDQETAAANRTKLALLASRQAAEDYLAVLEKKQEREIAGQGKGNAQRQFDAGLNSIDDNYASQRLQEENLRAQLEAEGKFTAEARAQYEARLQIINEFNGKAIASHADAYSQLMQKQRDWSVGASEAFQNYLDEASNTAKQVEGAFSNAFRSFEDAIANMVLSGKVSFKDLANSIIADLIRIQARAAASNLFSMIASFASAGSGGGIQGNDVALAFADGGNPPVGRASLVGEKGPELFVPKTAGTIIPNHKLGGTSVNIDFSGQVINVGAGVSRGEVMAAVQQSNAQTEERIRRSLRQGVYS